MSLHELAQKPETLLALQPEELAGFLLADFHVRDAQRRNTYCAENLGRDWQRYGEDVAEALMEAWAWLVREGLLIPSTNSIGTGFYQIGRRGRSLKTKQAVDSWRSERWLPKGMLHPVIVEKCWNSFLRGEYETAVFSAFRELEATVRDAGGFASTDLGTDLMRKAFTAKTGILSDKKLPTPEQEALGHLAAGAIGSYKNPSSHRRVTMTAQDAAEMIVLASHLLRIVDSRK